MKTFKLFFFIGIISLSASLMNAQDLNIDFGPAGSEVYTDFQAYEATTGDSASFGLQTYTAFGTTVGVQVSFSTTTANADKLAFARGYNITQLENLIDDWMGAKTNVTASEKLFITISDLPEGYYSWKSYHHDPLDLTGMLDIKFSDGNGNYTVEDIEISYGYLPASESAISTAERIFYSNGTDSVVVTVEFDPEQELSNHYTIINGFEISEGTPSTETDITGFILGEQSGSATIDNGTHIVDIETVFGTDVTTLTPTIILPTGAAITPGSGVEQDFTNPVIYTVTAEDGVTEQEWTINVSVAPTYVDVTEVSVTPDIDSLDPGQTVQLVETVLPISATDKTVTWSSSNESIATVSADGLVTAVAIGNATITAISNSDVTVVGTTQITVTTPASITFVDKTAFLSAEYQTNRKMEVTVNYEAGTSKKIDADGVTFWLRHLNSSWWPIKDYKVKDVSVANTQTGTLTAIIDLTGAALTDTLKNGEFYWFWVTAKDNRGNNISLQTYPPGDRINIIEYVKSTETDIIEFSLSAQTDDAIINTTNHTVEIEVGYETDVSALSPTITVSDSAAINPGTGTSQNFSSPVVYTVTAEDNAVTQDWTVTVTLEPEPLSTETDITGFTLSEQTEDATIDTIDHTVEIEVEYGTDISALTPTITISGGATINPGSGTSQDFSSPVVYTVSAEDNTITQDWTVTVTVEPDPLSIETDITSFTLTGQTGSATINGVNHTIEIEVESGTDISALAPTIVLSDNASVYPASGAAQDFSNPVDYTVTAEDNSITQVWTVIVTFIAPASVSNNLSGNIDIYPNPADKQINIDLSNLDGHVSLLLIDITGKAIYSQPQLTGGVHTINNQFKPGVYYLYVKNNNAQFVRKIIIE